MVFLVFCLSYFFFPFTFRERAKSKVNLPNPSELWILTRMNRRSRHDFKKAEDIGKKKRESWRVIEIDALFGFFCRGKLRCSEIVVRE